MFSQFKAAKTTKDKITIGIIIFTLSLLLLLTYSILSFFLYYWFITLAVMLLLLYSLFRTLGTIMMFPGYFNYYKGSIESNYSKEAYRKLSNSFKNLAEIHNYLVSGVFRNEDRESIRSSDANLQYFWRLFERFQNEGVLSKNKIELLDRINQLREVYNYEEEEKESIRKFMYSKHDLKSSKKPSTETSLKLQKLAEQASQYLQTFSTIEGNIFQKFYKQSYAEKLYEIRFSLGLYEDQYHYQEHFINKTTSLIIIRGFVDQEVNPSRKVVLFCNPNGAFIETFPFESSIVRFYVELGYNVALWNYRGYSKSVGEPSLTRNKEDVLVVYDFLKGKEYEIEIAHGYSIGGPTSIYLASERPVELLVTDRTFCSLQEVAKKFGRPAVFLLKLIFRSEAIDYSELYLNLSCRKLIIYDPLDDNIDNISSLKTGLARRVMSLIGEPQLTNFVQNSDENSGLYLNARAALRRILPEKQDKANHFPHTSFTKDLILNSLPFMTDKRKNPLKTTQRKPMDTCLQTAMESIHADLLKHSVQIKNDHKKAPNSTNKQLTDEVGHINYVDSAMMLFPTSFLGQFKYIVGNSDPIEQMKSYIQGLIVFGSYPVYREQVEKPGDIRRQTILKLSRLCKQLKEIEESISERFQEQENRIQSLRLQFCKIALTIYNSLDNPVFERVGMLLPVDCGHNGELKQHQYKLLEQIIVDGKESLVSVDHRDEIL